MEVVERNCRHFFQLQPVKTTASISPKPWSRTFRLGLSYPPVVFLSSLIIAPRRLLRVLLGTKVRISLPSDSSFLRCRRNMQSSLQIFVFDHSTFSPREADMAIHMITAQPSTEMAASPSLYRVRRNLLGIKSFSAILSTNSPLPPLVISGVHMRSLRSLKKPIGSA